MTKIEIAKEYMDLHNDIISDEYADVTDSEWKNLYDDLVGGEYGEVRPVEGFEGEFEIEIPSSDTNSGNIRIFTFEKV